jgi:adenylate cyclase
MISAHGTQGAWQADFSGESLLTAGAVRMHLERVLTSVTFTRAGRMSRFLRFIVEETLQGKGSQLKEYRIGVDVFDRNASYDPRIDPVVRSEARRLRSKLLEYYAEEGGKDKVRIHLAKGRYAAVFEAPGSGTADVEAAPLATTPASADLRSIAVLPFMNLTPHPENEYFSDGLTEELIHALGKLRGLRVVARTSVFQYKGKAYDVRQIGEQLHVRMVLEGSVRRFGERMRITTHLIDATDGYHVWSDSYDRSTVDSFTAQQELSSEIVSSLRQRLLGRAEVDSARRVSSQSAA